MSEQALLFKPGHPEQWVVIANPLAGNGRVDRQWKLLEPWLQRHLDRPLITRTERPAHAIELAEKAVTHGFRRILAIGGDGTCHEVANGILSQEQELASEVLLAILPVGTGNDWVKTYRIPNRGKAWLEMFRKGRSIKQDVGVVHYTDGEKRPAQRYFINVAGLAFDAYVIQQISNGKTSSVTAGFYLFQLLRHLMDYLPGPVRVEMNERCYEHDFFTIEIGMGRFAGGGMQVLPHALPNEGRFAVMLAQNTPKWEIVRHIWRFFNGSIARHPNIQLFRAKEIAIIPLMNSTIPLEADGEFLGFGPAHFTILPASLKVIVP